MESREEFAKVQFERSDDEGSSGPHEDDEMESVLSDMEIVEHFPDDMIKPSLPRSDAEDKEFTIGAPRSLSYL